MPRIFDNINDSLLKWLQQTLENSCRADFCVGFFNLRGWASIESQVGKWKGGPECRARVLIGMQRMPIDELKNAFQYSEKNILIDNKTASKLKKDSAQQFKNQLLIGTPTNRDEATLRKLSRQLKEGKVQVKLHLSFPLHAKLYLMHREDSNLPIVGVLGSSNLTMAGLEKQGELNIDVLDNDACEKLQKWFEERWNERYCLDITNELIEIIDESWASEKLIPPYHIYLKMVYHLSQEARAGLYEFKIPAVFRNELLAFQQAAVLISAKKLYNRGGVFIGDVVGLGKTITACAVAKIFEEDYYYSTLIICPANLVEMWKSYVEDFDLKAEVMSLGMVPTKLKDRKRFKLVILDESQNLRNNKGERYRVIKTYLRENESKVILLSATPYNKEFQDLSNQLKFFVPEDMDLGISPEQYIQHIGGYHNYVIQHPDTPVRSIRAFEKSHFTDDWRELIRLFMIRRTRSFIKENYAHYDEDNRPYLEFPNGNRSYFPDRIPKKLLYSKPDDPDKDQYARLYNETQVERIGSLSLPRYGLGQYVDDAQRRFNTEAENQILDDLSRAGKRLIGFCKTNLFKRLESSGYSFLLSICRHIHRNYIFIHALENDLPLPIGENYTEAVSSFMDWDDRDDFEGYVPRDFTIDFSFDPEYYIEKATNSYDFFNSENLRKRFTWVRSEMFTEDLLESLRTDTQLLLDVVRENPSWDPDKDRQLIALRDLVSKTHPNEKVLIFTQYADTANYLNKQLSRMNIKRLDVATGASPNPTQLAKQFSPISNKLQKTKNDLRVLIATDVLSEGQNLQDCHIMVNYDLPWAIIRLIQRAGRIDRIGQEAREILCYSVLPESGVNDIIRIRECLSRRIRQNAEAFGTDEVFFAGDPTNIQDLYNEKSGILDEEKDTEIDLGSYAYQIWKNAVTKDKSLEKTIANLPNIVYSSKAAPENRNSVVVYARTSSDNDILAWVDGEGNLISQAQRQILEAAQCPEKEPALPRLENHHKLVAEGIDLIHTAERESTGTLGRKSSIKHQAYVKLNEYITQNKDTIFVNETLKRAVESIYRYPLREYAKDLISRYLRTRESVEELARLVETLYEQNTLTVDNDCGADMSKPQIVCSMGFIAGENK